ncbi:hypothetical protein SDRG_15776 [Saprolegnia diclina VS20]|uniref:VLIG-type G domain-containing protein n=1 Tax=Saprolegnia diclina (strain VS20) TaxID=1156394 RepID=T0PW06_SAPDV|nr:hypothetical protein SDRG_15776 [Saprolegnia diclina VS20]EQC26431.1 hypothetical protein SDRG_15776 [Saprolegnia diclina VS20]|eukprot:XP_008620180.1 hypothetical protein SDRG_15776 [Saprolegnia diclina VS20]
MAIKPASSTCVQLLDFDVVLDHDQTLFQPTLVENSVLPLLQSLGFSGGATTVVDALQHLLSPDEDTDAHVDVIGCFGLQAAVRTELLKLGVWSDDVVATATADGVYAIHDRGTGHIVLFSWLPVTAYEPPNLTERTTFALRFLTSLTSKIIYCLGDSEWRHIQNAADVVSSESDDSMLMSDLQVHETTVVDAVTECKPLESTTALTSDDKSRGFGSLLPLHDNNSSFVTMTTSEAHYLDTNYKTQNFERSNKFAAWFWTQQVTQRLHAPSLPLELMKAVLKERHAYPSQELTEQSLKLQEHQRCMAVAQTALDRVHNKLLALAPTLFCVAPGATIASETDAMKAMDRILRELEPDVAKRLDFRPAVAVLMDGEYQEFLRRSNPVARSGRPLQRPYLAQSAFMSRTSASPHRQRLDAELAKWKNMLAHELGESYVGYTVQRQLQATDWSARLQTARTKLVRTLFRDVLAKHNAYHDEAAPQLAVGTVTARSKTYGVSFARYTLADGEKRATLLHLTRYPDATAFRIQLPLGADVVVCAIEQSNALVVYRHPQGGVALETHRLQQDALARLIKTETSQRTVLRGDYDPSTRRLALLHSDTNLVMYQLNATWERMKVLKDYNLASFNPTNVQHLLLCGTTDAPRILVVENDKHDSSARTYSLTTRAISNDINLSGKRVLKWNPNVVLVLSKDSASNAVRVEPLMTSSGMEFGAATVVALDDDWDWNTTTAMAYYGTSTLVFLNQVSMETRAFKVSLQFDETEWMYSPEVETDLDRTQNQHALTPLFHVLEKFPVSPTIYADGEKAQSLLPNSFCIHVATKDIHQETQLKTLLDHTMTQLQDLAKELRTLQLAKDCTTYPRDDPKAVQRIPRARVPLVRWFLELLAMVPIQVARAINNRLEPLRHGKRMEFPAASTVEIAQHMHFGLISTVLRHWPGKVSVISVMGKQSTGKSYFLNHFSGSSFAVSGARCTDGAWLTYRVLGDELLVVMDFEGLGSFERTMQEDVLLSILNAAVSRCTVFRLETRFDRDLDNMLTSIQQGASLIKDYDPAFKGALLLNVRDVNPPDMQTVKAELGRKLASVRNAGNDFAATMYVGDPKSVLSPGNTNRKYYSALTQMYKFMMHGALRYESGRDYHDCLTLLLAKIKTLDWTSMKSVVKDQKARQWHNKVTAALANGKVPNTGGRLGDLAPLEQTPERLREVYCTEEGVTIDMDPKQVLALDEIVFPLTGKEPLRAMQLCLDVQRKSFLGDKQRTKELDAKFITYWQFAVWLREHRVFCWYQKLSINNRPELEGFESSKCDFQNLAAPCKANCSECHLLCVQMSQHATKPNASATHSCGTDHKCPQFCAHCPALNDARSAPCALMAGHEGHCNCATAGHTCQKICGLQGSRKCDVKCQLPVDHAGSHRCAVKAHLCPHRCEAPSCTAFCSLGFDENHDRHECGATFCCQPCDMPNCFKGGICIGQSHFHEAEHHQCGNSHVCGHECEVPGFCYHRSEPQRGTFVGKESQFEYDVRHVVGERNACNVVLEPGVRNHGGGHKCTAELHSCQEKCPSCNYICELPMGHANRHKTTHGNMVQAAFASLASGRLKISDRTYCVGDSCAPEMCPLLCKELGRGHGHLLRCQYKSKEECEANPTAGRTHSTHTNAQGHAMDSYLHAAYLAEIGWEDAVEDRADRNAFELCPHQCPAPSHSDAPAYCILGAGHTPVTGRNTAGGHEFNCGHVVTGSSQHVLFVLSSSSASEASWVALLASVRACIKKLSPNDVISIATFAYRGGVEYECQPVEAMKGVNFSRCGSIFNYYSSGMKEASAIFSRNVLNQTSRAPVIIFFTADAPRNKDDGAALGAALWADYERLGLRSFCLGFGEGCRAPVTQLANALHGNPWIIATTDALAMAMDDIADHIRSS